MHNVQASGSDVGLFRWMSGLLTDCGPRVWAYAVLQSGWV